MKVCKVVFNSVSHDARVLKEAISVAELGHETVIIGIQDANNGKPIETYENMTIKRAAWKSEALKPYLFLYFMELLFIIGIAFIVGFVGLSLLEQIGLISSSIMGYLSFQNIFLFFVFGYTGKKLLELYLHYKKRKKVALSALSQEKNEMLKIGNEAVKEFSQIKTGEKQKKKSVKSSFVQRNYPRPIMTGLKSLLDVVALKTWKTVFARENVIYKILVEEKPDVVHSHDISALPVCAKYKRNYGCKLVFDAHEMYDHLAQSENDMSTMNRKTMIKYSSDVDAFITINDSIGNYYKNSYPDFPKAVIVKNAAPYAESVEYDGRLHEVIGLPKERKILLYQGGFAPKRGLLQLLMSAEYLSDEWTLVFMGWGRLQYDMKRVTDALIQKDPKMAEKIKFAPKVKQKELPHWSAGATLGVIPYENTGLNHWFCTPNKLWEYPNAGVPIIASPFPEMQKVIEPNNIGWFLPDPLTPKDIAKAINSLSDEELLEARNRCREFIANDNWSKYAKRVQKIYGELK